MQNVPSGSAQPACGSAAWALRPKGCPHGGGLVPTRPPLGHTRALAHTEAKQAQGDCPGQVPSCTQTTTWVVLVWSACSSSWAQEPSLAMQPLHLCFQPCFPRLFLNQERLVGYPLNTANCRTVPQSYSVTLCLALQRGGCKGWHRTKDGFPVLQKPSKSE